MTKLGEWLELELVEAKESLARYTSSYAVAVVKSGSPGEAMGSVLTSLVQARARVSAFKHVLEHGYDGIEPRLEVLGWGIGFLVGCSPSEGNAEWALRFDVVRWSELVEERRILTEISERLRS